MEKNITDGTKDLKNANLRLRINMKITKKDAENQKIFSTDAKRLDVLVTSVPNIGLYRNVKVEYGARHAIQKYLSIRVEPDLGHVWDSIAEAAVSLFTSWWYGIDSACSIKTFPGFLN